MAQGIKNHVNIGMPQIDKKYFKCTTKYFEVNKFPVLKV